MFILTGAEGPDGFINMTEVVSSAQNAFESSADAKKYSATIQVCIKTFPEPFREAPTQQKGADVSIMNEDNLAQLYLL